MVAASHVRKISFSLELGTSCLNSLRMMTRALFLTTVLRTLRAGSCVKTGNTLGNTVEVAKPSLDIMADVETKTATFSMS